MTKYLLLPILLLPILLLPFLPFALLAQTAATSSIPATVPAGLTPPAPATSITAAEIMRRVAENQDQAKAARTAYVYDEDVFVRLKRAGGKTAREESRRYTVLPDQKGNTRELVKVEGKIFNGKTVIPYTEAGFRRGTHADVDADITDSFAGHVMWKKSGDVPLDDWFPLSSERSKNYEFHLKGEERYRDYDVYRIAFETTEESEDCWTGEALIEKNDLQPVLVTSAFTCKMPKAVSILLGTNFSHIGAKITYQRVAPGVWFPANCGGELKFRILFFYARTVAFTAKNSGFRKADVQSGVTFESIK